MQSASLAATKPGGRAALVPGRTWGVAASWPSHGLYWGIADICQRYSPIFDDAREAASLTWCGVWVTAITSVGVFGRVVQRSYSAVAGLSSIAPSFGCSTHNRRYRYQQWEFGITHGVPRTAMLTAKVNFLTAHCCIIGALMPDRQSQISYRRVNAPIATHSFQFGRA